MGIELTRRDFLKLSAALGGAIAGSMVGVARVRAETPQDKDAIKIGLTETTFVFGNHVVDERIIPNNTQILVGELQLGDMRVYKNPTSQRPPSEPFVSDSVRFLSNGGSTFVGGESRWKHEQTLHDLKGKNIPIVLTDMKMYLTKQELDLTEISALQNSDRIRMIVGGLALGTIPVSFAGAYLTNCKRWEREERSHSVATEWFSRREFLKILAKGAGVVATLGSGFGLLAQNDRVQISMQSLSVTLQEFVGSLSDPDKQYFYRLSEMRNRSMARNAKVVARLLQYPEVRKIIAPKNPDSINVLFFAGNAHSGAKNEFSRSEKELEMEIAKSADWIINTITEKFVDLKIKRSNGEIDSVAAENRRQELLDHWMVLTSVFNYPIPSFADTDQYLNSPKMLDIPLTPRAILWSLLRQRVNDRPNDQILEELIIRLAEEDTAEFVGFPEYNALKDRAARHISPKDPVYNINLKRSQKRIKVKLFEGMPIIDDA